MIIKDSKNIDNYMLEEIERRMGEEKDVKVYKKLIYLRFKELGYSTKESYHLANIKKSTAYNIEDNWSKNGYDGLLPKKRVINEGRNPKLNKNQIKELDTILKTKDSWAVKEVQKLIKDKWNIKYTYMGTKNLLNTQFNTKIENYYEQKRKKHETTENIIDQYQNLKTEDKNEIKTIIRYMDKEKDLFVYNKLVFLLLKKIGFSTNVASSLLNKTEVTGNNWLKQWENGGHEELKRKPGQGRKPKLTEEQWDDLKKN